MVKRLKHDSNIQSCSAKCRNGFTLTEVIVASAILAFAMVPILRGLSSTHIASVSVERKTQSLILARSNLEKLRAYSVNNFDLLSASSNTSLMDNYLCNVSVSATADDLRDITVSVGYDENQNSVLDQNEIDTTLQSLIARRS